MTEKMTIAEAREKHPGAYVEVREMGSMGEAPPMIFVWESEADAKDKTAKCIAYYWEVKTRNKRRPRCTRTDLIPGVVFSWHGGSYLSMQDTKAPDRSVTRHYPEIKSEKDAELVMEHWAREYFPSR